MSSKNKRLKAESKRLVSETEALPPYVPKWEKAMRRLLPEEISEWLASEMRAAINAHYHPDKFRWAEVGDAVQEAHYQEVARRGCCGFYEEKVVHPKTGRIFRIGMNYGH